MEIALIIGFRFAIDIHKKDGEGRVANIIRWKLFNDVPQSK